MLRERARDILQINIARPQPLSGMDQTVYTVWQSSVDRAASDARYARDVLRVLSVLAAERIPRSIFSTATTGLASADPLEVEKALASLASYSLINLTENFISLHRLVQRAEVAHMEASGPDVLLHNVSLAATLLNQSFPSDPDDSDLWPESTQLLPHATNLSDLADYRGIMAEEMVWLECHTAGYLNARGARHDAKRILKRAERHVSKDNSSIPVRGLIYVTLARTERNLGDLDAAKEHAIGAVKLIGEAATVPDVSIAGHNILGRVFMDLREFPQAEAEFRNSMDIVLSAHLSSTRHEIVVLNNLGRVLLRLGAFDEAEKLLQRALSVDRAIHAKPHADTAWSLDNLAMARFALGDVQDAEDFLNQALSIESAVHGPDHPRSAWSLRNLAVVLMAQRRIKEAHTLLERSLDIIETSTPDNRVEMVATLTLLEQTETALGNQRRANELRKQLKYLSAQ
jgi:tetratricopeptide (TPR) repeat protein